MKKVIVIIISLAVFGLIGQLVMNTANVSKETMPTETPKQIESTNITATFQTHKEIDGKHRYFFDIRNDSDKPFTGDVEIRLHNSQDNTLAKEVFSAKDIAPTLGSYGYLEARTAPVGIFDAETGISKFTFTVTVDGEVTQTGEGAIVL